MTLPLRYTPSVEVPEKDELQTQQQLIDTLLSISKTTLKDEQEALRAVHAKSHGVLAAVLIVPGDLPETLAQGLFATPGRYDAVVRLSSAPGDLLPDTISTHHGFALKVKGVTGPALPGAEPGSQDFLFANGKAFNTPTAASFLKTLKMLAATTDKAESVKVALATALRGIESTLESVGGQSALLTSLGGHPASHILAEEFFTQVPIRYGDYIAKLGLYPVTPEQKALADSNVDLAAEFDAHRQDVRAYLDATPAAWELRVQLCTSLETMPVEKPDTAWPEDESPYLTIARLEISPQDSYSDAMVAAVDKSAMFSPWNGLAVHQPLGAINRVRKPVYEASTRFRLSKNGCPYHQAAE
jgi:hypothetical protein